MSMAGAKAFNDWDQMRRMSPYLGGKGGSSGGGSVASMVTNSLTHKLADQLDPGSTNRYLASILAGLGSSYEQGTTGDTRAILRNQAMALDPNSLVNGGNASLGMPGPRFDNGGVVAPTGGRGGGQFRGEQGWQSRMGEALVSPKDKPSAFDYRRDRQVDKEADERKRREEEDRALQRREIEMRIRSQKRSDELDAQRLQQDAANSRQNQLLQLLQIAGGLRFAGGGLYK